MSSVSQRQTEDHNTLEKQTLLKERVVMVDQVSKIEFDDWVLDKINVKDSSLNSVEEISFKDIQIKNNDTSLIQKLLDIIFDHEKLLFSGLKKLSFGDLEWEGKLKIPSFNGLEILEFKNIKGNLTISPLPALTRFSYYRESLGFSALFVLNELKSELELKGLPKIKDHDQEFLEFLSFIEDDSKSGYITAITIDVFRNIERYKHGIITSFDATLNGIYVQQLIDFIHSNQNLLTGLRKIKINEGYEVKLEFPESSFLERIKIERTELLVWKSQV